MFLERTFGTLRGLSNAYPHYGAIQPLEWTP